MNGGRRVRRAGALSAAFVMLLVGFALASAPVLAAGPQSRTQAMGMADIATPSEIPCDAMEGHDDRSKGDHDPGCVAACLSAHGALLPEMPSHDAVLHEPAAIAEAGPAHALADLPFGLDPPPPRLS